METLHLQVRAPQLYPDIRMLRARWRGLETEPNGPPRQSPTLPVCTPKRLSAGQYRAYLAAPRLKALVLNKLWGVEGGLAAEGVILGLPAQACDGTRRLAPRFTCCAGAQLDV